MKREAFNTTLLIICVALCAFVAYSVYEKPSLHEIDDRVQYWLEHYQTRDRLAIRSRRPSTDPPPPQELAAESSAETATAEDEAATGDPDGSVEPSLGEQPEPPEPAPTDVASPLNAES